MVISSRGRGGSFRKALPTPRDGEGRWHLRRHLSQCVANSGTAYALIGRAHRSRTVREWALPGREIHRCLGGLPERNVLNVVDHLPDNLLTPLAAAAAMAAHPEAAPGARALEIEAQRSNTRRGCGDESSNTGTVGKELAWRTIR